MADVHFHLVPVGVPFIDLPTSMGSVDLHNFADFDRLELRAGGRLQLDWSAHAPGMLRVGNESVDRVSLVLEGVSSLSLSPRDAALPSSEDRTLEDLTVERVTGETCQLRLEFANGASLRVTARAAALWSG